MPFDRASKGSGHAGALFFCVDETISATGLRCKNIKCKYAFTERLTGRQVSPCKLPPGSERFKFRADESIATAIEYV